MNVKRTKIKTRDVFTAIMLALLISVTGIILSGCGSGETRDQAPERSVGEATGTAAGTIVPSDSSVTLDPGDTQAFVTAVDGGTISVSIGGAGGFGGDGSQGRPDDRMPGGFGGQGGFGGSNGFSDISGGKKDGDAKTDEGKTDGKTDGENGSDDNSSAADPNSNGQFPGFPGSDGSGQMPAPPTDGNGQFRTPSGEDGQFPGFPGSDGSGGDGKGGRGGVSATLTVADESIIFKADGTAASLSDITAGVSLTITIGEGGSVTRIVINDKAADPAFPASGGENL